MYVILNTNLVQICILYKFLSNTNLSCLNLYHFSYTNLYANLVKIIYKCVYNHVQILYTNLVNLYKICIQICI